MGKGRKKRWIQSSIPEPFQEIFSNDNRERRTRSLARMVPQLHRTGRPLHPPLASHRVSAVGIPCECVYGSRGMKDRRFGRLERGGGRCSLSRSQLDNASSHKNARLPASLPDPDLPQSLNGTFPGTSKSGPMAGWAPGRSFLPLHPISTGGGGEASGHDTRGKGRLGPEHQLGGASMQGKGQPGSTWVQQKDHD